MTQQIQISNISNWTTEDVEITIEHSGNEHRDPITSSGSFKPGKSTSISPMSGDEASGAAEIVVRIRFRQDSENSEPFTLDGRQVTPSAFVGFN